MNVPKPKYAVGSVAQAAAEGADTLLSEARKDVVAARNPEPAMPEEIQELAETVGGADVGPEMDAEEAIPEVAQKNLQETTKLINSFEFQGGNAKMDKAYIMESLSEVADSPIVESKQTIAEFITDLHRVQIEQESKPLLSPKDFKKLTSFATEEERVEKNEGGEMMSDADKYIILYKQMETSLDKAKDEKARSRIYNNFEKSTQGFDGSDISEALQKIDAEGEARDPKFLGGLMEKMLDKIGGDEKGSIVAPIGQDEEASISALEGPDPIEKSNNAPITNVGYAEGGNVEKKEKLENILQAGEDGADKAIVEIMKYIPGSEGPPKGLVDFLEPVLRKAGEMYRENKKIKKAGGGSLMSPDMPVDTYDNIPPEKEAEVKASQLPDDEMEDEYAGFVMDKALSTEDQEYLLGALEGDERLGDIFDKIMDRAGEFAGEGAVEGPGTGTSDSIPARLSDGEFVFTRKATDQIGTDQLQTMMDDAERAYDGGLMKKYMGGSILDSVGDEVVDPDKGVHDQMLKANAMPSVRNNR